MKSLLFVLCCFGITTVGAQVLPTDTVPAIINYTTKDGVTEFSSELRPLRQIAGAPAHFILIFGSLAMVVLVLKKILSISIKVQTRYW